MQKLGEQLQLLRQATPLLRQRAQQLTDAQAAEVREQLALVLDQQTDQFEESMKVRLCTLILPGHCVHSILPGSARCACPCWAAPPGLSIVQLRTSKLRKKALRCAVGATSPLPTT